ncbi:MAG: T9SS type A sorting domain-containing protein [Candidatus Cloacimonadota bacterium]|nr:MAG: T9SS type A sorting domain-containing protein [Candidatus Cloacimonadota bacterium]
MILNILFSIILMGGMNLNPDHLTQKLDFPEKNPFYQCLPLVDSTSFELLGSTLYANACCDVVADNAYMYVFERFPGYNGQIKVFDIHNPSNPCLYSATNIPNVPWTNYPYLGRNIAKESDYLLVSYEDFRTKNAHLATFDVSDPSLPIFLDSVYLGNADPWCMDTKNWIAYVCTYYYYQPSHSGIFSIDFSSPQSLIKRDTIPGIYYGLAIGEEYLYAYCYDSLKIVSIDSFGSMTFEGYYIFSQWRDISGIHTWRDSLIFVINFDYFNNLTMLSIIDVSNPTNAFLIAEDSLPFFDFYGSYGMTGNDSIIFYTQDTLLCIIDISNPMSPNFLSTFEMPYHLGSSKGMFLRENILFTANDIQGTQIIDVSNPSILQLLGRYRTNGLVHGVSLKYPFAYVAAGGLAVVNISNPSNPEILGIYGRQLLKEANDVSCNENHVFVGSNSGITIFNISNPQVPIYESHLPIKGIQRLLLHDSLLFASNPNLYIVDVAQPGNPQILYSCDSVYLSDFDIYNNLLCWVGMVDTISYLQILDVTNPSNPLPIGSVDIYQFPLAMATNDTFAYITNLTHSQVVNLSDISNPYIVSTFTLSDVHDIKIVSNKLFTIGNYNNGSRGVLSVFDLTNPIIPHRIASSITSGIVYNNKLTLHNNYIYLCNREAFVIYEFSETGISEGKQDEKWTPNISVSPNPFRNRISISLSCKKDNRLQISIYDVAGRKVKELFNRKPLSNKVSLGWDGTDEKGKTLPQGTYFLKINQEVNSQVIKIVRLN